jgi:hypothetical protein
MKEEHCGLKEVFEETGCEESGLDSYESQVIQCGICDEKSGSGAGFLRTLPPPPLVLITLPLLDTHLYAEICTIGPYDAEIQWNLIFARHLQIKKLLVVNVQFKALTAVVLKSHIFWYTTTCNPFKLNCRFSGTFRLNVQGLTNKPSKQPS